MNLILDFFFPPLCLSCQERCATAYLCPSCWQLCSPPDPVDRCGQCFAERDSPKRLCQRCIHNPTLPVERAFVFDPDSPAPFLGLEAVEALAGFALYQWIQLDWPVPDALIPLPNTASVQIGKALATLLGCPFIRALRSNSEYVADRLEEEGTWLLFEVSNDTEKLKKAVEALSLAFPKRVYLLSLGV